MIGITSSVIDSLKCVFASRPRRESHRRSEPPGDVWGRVPKHQRGDDASLALQRAGLEELETSAPAQGRASSVRLAHSRLTASLRSRARATEPCRGTRAGSHTLARNLAGCGSHADVRESNRLRTTLARARTSRALRGRRDAANGCGTSAPTECPSLVAASRIEVATPRHLAGVRGAAALPCRILAAWTALRRNRSENSRDSEFSRLSPSGTSSRRMHRRGRGCAGPRPSRWAPGACRPGRGAARRARCTAPGPSHRAGDPSRGGRPTGS